MNCCPKDSGSLLIQDPVDRGVWLCKTCWGLWISGHLVEGIIGHALRLSTSALDPSACRCPKDTGTLFVVKKRGVEIDYCPKCHGIWLDKGELEHIKSVKKTSIVPDILDVASSGIDIGPSTGKTIGGVFEFLGDAFSSSF